MMAKFADVLEIKNGRNQRMVENPDGRYPIYGSGGIMGYANEYLCEAEAVILGRKGSINAPIFAPQPCWNIDTAFGLIAKKEKLLPKYLYYFCQYFDFSQLNTTVTIPSLTKANLLNIQISLPALNEQTRIVSCLDNLSRLLKKRQEQFVQIDAMVKSRFIEMFGDPATNPKGWGHGRIRDITSEVKYGTSKPANESGQYPYLRMNNITYDGHLDLSDLKFIDLPDSEIEKYIVRHGDLLFNRTNSKELVGKTCVFNIDTPMVVAGYIIRVRMNERAIPEYLSSVLNSDYGKSTLRALCKQIIGQANINAQELQNIEILIPPLSLQNSFADFVRQADKSKFAMKKSLDELETLYKALMRKYFG